MPVLGHGFENEGLQQLVLGPGEPGRRRGGGHLVREVVQQEPQPVQSLAGFVLPAQHGQRLRAGRGGRGRAGADQVPAAGADGGVGQVEDLFVVVAAVHRQDCLLADDERLQLGVTDLLGRPSRGPPPPAARLRGAGRDDRHRGQDRQLRGHPKQPPLGGQRGASGEQAAHLTDVGQQVLQHQRGWYRADLPMCSRSRRFMSSSSPRS